VQGDARELVYGASDAGLSVERARFFATAAEAGEFLAHLVEPGDLVLIKGSRGVHMERVVEALDARFARAEAEHAAPALQGVREEPT
jgi:UDP-N-acetylmuramoyl-tripeptide--D-alanyl-D-alanine ligase